MTAPEVAETALKMGSRRALQGLTTAYRQRSWCEVYAGEHWR